MDERRIFTNDTWSGAHYELAIELGLPSDDRLVAAAAALWQHPSLDGPYADRKREPWLQELVSPSLILSDDLVVHTYGVATLPDGTKVAAGNLATREGRYRGYRRPEWPLVEVERDWLKLYITMEALASIYGFDTVEDVDWPGWLTLDDWLADIGRTVFHAVPFALGMIGEETNGAVNAEDVKAARPDKLPYSMLLPNEHGGVDWHPLPGSDAPDQ